MVEENQCQNDLQPMTKCTISSQKLPCMHAPPPKGGRGRGLWQEPFTRKHIYNSAQLLVDQTSWM